MSEDYVVCPFDKSHIISRLRIQYHLVKCKKNNPCSDKIVCPYDATEYIDPVNFYSHLNICKRKLRLDVSEEFRQKQYESMKHGDSRSQTFHPPNVEVTDEWNNVSNDNEDDLTVDELKNIDLKNKTSKTIQLSVSSCLKLPLPLGRGIKPDLFKQYKKKLQHVPESSTANELVRLFPLQTPAAASEEIIDNNSLEGIGNNSKYEETDIYEDAEEDKEVNVCVDNQQTSSISNKSCSGLSDVRESQKSNSISHFTPTIGRGATKNSKTQGRGITAGRAMRLENLHPMVQKPNGTKKLDNIIINECIRSENRNQISCNIRESKHKK